ncbi:MAG: phosphotransferase [Anaerolineae bacterium]|nr:phosphotransferase [Anaerolineae bacterium]
MSTSQPLLWTQPGWVAEAQAWITTELNHQNIHVSGEFDQFHIRPWSTLFRIPSSQGDVYFKAVVPALAYEAALTQILSKYQPEPMPRLLAVDTARGWLLMADGGKRLRETFAGGENRHLWMEVLSRYANFQKGVFSHVDELIYAGVPDRSCAQLPAIFDELLASKEALCLDQPNGLALTEYQELIGHREKVIRLSKELATSGIPESIDHGDFHDGNILVQNGKILFFDWGDSGVTHPFFSHAPCSSVWRILSDWKNTPPNLNHFGMPISNPGRGLPRGRSC